LALDVDTSNIDVLDGRNLPDWQPNYFKDRPKLPERQPPSDETSDRSPATSAEIKRSRCQDIVPPGHYGRWHAVATSAEATCERHRPEMVAILATMLTPFGILAKVSIVRRRLGAAAQQRKVYACWSKTCAIIPWNSPITNFVWKVSPRWRPVTCCS
jgi:hypothetical protein